MRFRYNICVFSIHKSAVASVCLVMWDLQCMGNFSHFMGTGYVHPTPVESEAGNSVSWDWWLDQTYPDKKTFGENKTISLL